MSCPKCGGHLMRSSYGDDEPGCLMCGWRAAKVVISPPLPAEKRCHKCGVRRPIEQFAPNTRNADGRSAWCRHCVEVNRERRAERRKEARCSA